MQIARQKKINAYKCNLVQKQLHKMKERKKR